MATENARRTNMPDEYVLTGMSMKVADIGEGQDASRSAPLISCSFRPRTAPYMKTFSRPVNSGLNPAPSSSSAATRPCSSTDPVVGVSVPHMSCSSVDLPEPLRPMMPTVAPGATSKLTSRSAQNSR